MRTFLAAVILVAGTARILAAQKPDSLARERDAVPQDTVLAMLRALQARVDSLRRAGGGGMPAPGEQPSPQAPSGRGMYMNIGFSGLSDFGWSTQRDVGVLQRGDHDPAVRGFTIPNEELTLDGAVDPYFKGFVDLVYKLDRNGESLVELEEAYVLTTSLPANLQLRVGQFFTEFGRQNQQHPHAWASVDQPLVLNRMFGPEGLRSQGARIAWLAPTPWYTEAMVSVLNSAGETNWSFRSEASSEIHGGVPVPREVQGVGDLLIAPRVTASLDLSATQTLLMGVSGAFGPNNSGPDARTQIYGADLYWKWKSARASAGFPFVSWQTEALFRRYDATERAAAEDPQVVLPAEQLRDRGVYSQILWGVKPRVVLGLRGELVSASPAAFSAVERTSRNRLSPSVTWYPSEYSKLRLQYNYDDRKGIGTDHSLWLQFEFILGAHAAHKF